jgi:hypothetical protein
MTSFLQRLLQIDEPMFSVGMNQLEKSTGSRGIDTRLIADIVHKAHSIMRRLGLDPADTTGKELYRALLSTVKQGSYESLLFDADYILLVFDNNVISFNLIDVIENNHHELTYEQCISSHGGRSLRGEVVQRYLKHVKTDASIMRDIAANAGLLPESDEWYNEQKFGVYAGLLRPNKLSQLPSTLSDNSLKELK